MNNWIPSWRTAKAPDALRPLTCNAEALEDLCARRSRETSQVPAGDPQGAAGAREQLLSIFARSGLEMVYQPVIRLDGRTVAFFEALARFGCSPGRGPADWFAAAAAAGLRAELEMLAIRRAIRGLDSLPDASAISINASPATVLRRDFPAVFDSVSPERIVIELTEQDSVPSYDQLTGVLAPLRRRGIRIAVDDAGAGHSSFRHILQLRPDIIKLDASLCRGIDEDPMQRALVSALVTFSRQVGSELVAEGVESTGELECLRDLGMLVIQGNVLARPMRAEAIAAAHRQSCDSARSICRCLSDAA